MSGADNIPAISGIEDTSSARVMLYQANRPVHAPIDAVGLLTEADAATTYQPLDADLTAIATWSREAIRGHLHGLTLSNNGSDATNDIDIAAGVATCIDATPFPIVLGSAITKRLDATWSVGTNQGGLDTGSIANATYHVWLIRRSDTGVVDVLFSTSATSPTMPTNYDQKRRIGSILRESAAIVTFNQEGDIFQRAAVTDRNSTAAAASALLTLSVPTGIIVQPILSATEAPNSASVTYQFLGSASQCAATQFAVRHGSTVSTTPQRVTASVPPVFSTNTSAQLYFAHVLTAGTAAESILITNGWIDTRGRLN